MAEHDGPLPHGLPTVGLAVRLTSHACVLADAGPAVPAITPDGHLANSPFQGRSGLLNVSFIVAYA
jgi:hypothetical protein